MSLERALPHSLAPPRKPSRGTVPAKPRGNRQGNHPNPIPSLAHNTSQKETPGASTLSRADHFRFTMSAFPDQGMVARSEWATR